MIVVRAARPSDLAALMELADLSGPGFTSLPENPEVLERRLRKSAASFASTPEGPGEETYMLMLEDTETERVLGCAAVKAQIGKRKPFFNFRVFTIAQASMAAGRRFDLDVMVLVNEFGGCTEVGSLFVRAEGRGGGVGRLLAQARYLLMAADRKRFAETVLAELRGVVEPNGRSPFWDHLGAKFFQMSFKEADELSGISDNQFIVDLMPKYPIYIDLLPPEARAVIGQTHPDGVPARRMLEWEGYRYDRVVDIFDGGPLMSAPRDQIRTVRESEAVTLELAEVDGEALSVFLSSDLFSDFRVCRTRARVRKGVAVVPPEAAAAVGLGAGDTARVWIHR